VSLDHAHGKQPLHPFLPPVLDPIPGLPPFFHCGPTTTAAAAAAAAAAACVFLLVLLFFSCCTALPTWRDRRREQSRSLLQQQ
jgi:hypothetical protein